MPALWSPHAVRAQAVAARTYAAYERDHAPASRHYQLCDTTSCQVYGGYAQHPGLRRAVAAPASACSAAAGRRSRSSRRAPAAGPRRVGALPGRVQDPYDGWSGNPFHDWSLRVTDTAIERTWPRIGNLTRLAVTARDGGSEWGGRVRSVTVTGDDGVVVVTGDGFGQRWGRAPPG